MARLETGSVVALREINCINRLLEAQRRAQSWSIVI